MEMWRRGRGRMADRQGRTVSFVMVVMVMGVVLIISSYNGLLKSPLQRLGLADSGVVHMESGHTHYEGHSGQFVYGIMFDAGSTGSRIHAFKFFRGDDGSMKYLDELFEQVKPGLSAYAADPNKAADSLRPLLDSASKYIPAADWKHSPMALKATAGLRMLPEQQANNLLNSVRELFESSEFLTDLNAVQIMDGMDEGVFSWFTLNLLAGAFDSGDVSKSIGVMDLGGGSTQLTMVPTDKGTVESAPSDYILKKDLLGSKVDLYTHSYLGLGLMSGRLSVLKASQKDGAEEGDDLLTACFASDIKHKWQHGSSEYTIHGVDSTSPRFDNCYNTAKSVVAAAHIHKPMEAGKRQFALISYYYDKAVDSGLITFEEGGYLKVEDYVNAAKKECGNPNKDEPFLCLDLCYISALLQDGFGFPLNGQLMLKKKIDGTEISWALGAMFDLFKTQSSTS